MIDKQSTFFPLHCSIRFDLWYLFWSIHIIYMCIVHIKIIITFLYYYFMLLCAIGFLFLTLFFIHSHLEILWEIQKKYSAWKFEPYILILSAPPRPTMISWVFFNILQLRGFLLYILNALQKCPFRHNRSLNW